METVQESDQPVPTPEELPREPKFKNSAADWGVRALIFVVFLFFGTGKFKHAPDAPWVVLFDQIGLGQWLRYVAGGLEVGGAFLVLLSGAVEIGLAVLMATMFCALVISLVVLHKFSETYFPFAFLCGMVAFWLHRRRV